ncbi:hypothetical protein ACLBR5_12480 [Escherichia coli]
MPEGPVQSGSPADHSPPKERTLQHIETLTTHFLEECRLVMPAKSPFQIIEATKGITMTAIS